MKAHIFRELVNDLRDVATQWHGYQQLRERISGRLRQDVSINEDPANDGWIPWAGGKWQTIETAPKASFCCCAVRLGTQQLRWFSQPGSCAVTTMPGWIHHANNDLVDWGFEPTHGTPLPAPPEGLRK